MVESIIFLLNWMKKGKRLALSLLLVSLVKFIQLTFIVVRQQKSTDPIYYQCPNPADPIVILGPDWHSLKKVKLDIYAN